MEAVTSFLIIVGGLAFIYILICGGIWIIKTHGFIAFLALFLLFFIGDAVYSETATIELSNNTVIQCHDLELGEQAWKR